MGFYIVGCLIASVIGDFSPPATNYLARQDNFLNQYFVKLGWGWTLLVSAPFVAVTSHVYSCGNVSVVKSSLARLAAATAVWYCFTSAFVAVEARVGVCQAAKMLSKAACSAAGSKWRGFDISGHCFLLVWNNLFMIEEARAYLGWERIRDMLRDEEHLRLNTDPSGGQEGEKAATALSKLSLEEFLHLRKSYLAHTPTVRLLFCLMGCLVLLWDVMLVCTALFFHMMIEKVLATGCAVLVWFVLYRGVYANAWPGLAGAGPFKYVVEANVKANKARRPISSRKPFKCDHHQKDDLPKFMGMPLYGLNPQNRGTSDMEESEQRHNNPL